MRWKFKKGLIKQVFILLFGFIMMFPLLWMLSSSLKPANEIFSSGLNLIPSKLEFNNYIIGWKAIPPYTFSLFFMNTFLVCIPVALGCVVSASLTAYGFARINFKFRNILFAVLIGTLMMPNQLLTIPQYLIFNKLQWINTYFPFHIPAFLAQFSGAFFIFLLVQFIRGIPRELDESAYIDGCNRFKIYLYIILPLSRPALATIAIFSFIWSWNDFYNQLIYINDVRKFTVSLALRIFMDNFSAISWGAVFAMSLVSMLPLFILFFMAQKYFVEGIITTGLKG